LLKRLIYWIKWPALNLRVNRIGARVVMFYAALMGSAIFRLVPNHSLTCCTQSQNIVRRTFTRVRTADCSSEQDDDVLSDTTDIYGDSESDAYLSCNEFETSDSESESILNEENLQNLLAKWATQFNISLAAFGNLLHLLHQYHPFFYHWMHELYCAPLGK